MKNMRLRNIIAVERRFLLLLIVNFACARSVEPLAPSETTHGGDSHAETSTKDEPSGREETTTTTTTASLEAAVVDTTGNDGPDDVFRPSLHLGEIERSTIRTNPFNNVQDVKFEGGVRPDEQFRDILQDQAYQGADVPSVLDEATRPSRIKFQDDDALLRTSVHRPYDDRGAAVVVTESPRSSFDEATGVQLVDQHTFFQQHAAVPSVAQDASTIFGKSKTDHGLTTGTYFDASRSPYVVGYYDADAAAYQPLQQPLHQETAYVEELTRKPAESGVLLLQQQESTYTRKRKFPYPFYQPFHTAGYHGVEFAADEPRHTTAVYPQMGNLTPWKKIIHLIGTLLPLGLLLATLKPNVVRINTTPNSISQPSDIVLSKLRAADLPVEHKRARSLDDQPAVCEDRSICELILAGGEPKSNILQNILWNLATRISDDVAKRNGLRELFSAVKKKDCTTIGC